MVMGKAEWGRLTEAWKGEATDFTPELARHLETLDTHLALGLSTDAMTEVPADGGRRIDILATGSDNVRYVIENQYGRADHDHLTRGLAYAISADAQGLIVVAEEHRDEFKAVANYLNDVAAHAGKGIKVWLVEAQAVRVNDSPWAPVFTVVAEPIPLIEKVASGLPGYERAATVESVLDSYQDVELRDAATALASAWLAEGLKLFTVLRGGKHVMSLMAPGPAASGARVVITAYPDGKLSVPFGAYEGKNSGRPIFSLATDDFKNAVSAEFGLDRSGYTSQGWFTPARLDDVLDFCRTVRDAYRVALDDELSQPPAFG